MKKPRSNDAKTPADREGEILDAARCIFSRRGFEAATIQEVAEAAGIAKGTVYLYFKSKDELYAAALTRGLEELHEESAAAMARESTAAGKLRAFIATRFSYLERHNEFFRIYFVELGHSLIRTEGKDAAKERLYRSQAEVLAKVIENGIAAGELRPVRPAMTALMVLDLTRSTLVHRLRGWSKATAAEDEAHLFDLLWKGIER
ncbi:MAG: TetR/AcrR family transcriptional regulator [Acidobacteria bacterium]|nr:TetR/AcrR family transcriptional regulator [Acidobacteriota bacterium]